MRLPNPSQTEVRSGWPTECSTSVKGSRRNAHFNAGCMLPLAFKMSLNLCGVKMFKFIWNNNVDSLYTVCVSFQLVTSIFSLQRFVLSLIYLKAANSKFLPKAEIQLRSTVCLYGDKYIQQKLRRFLGCLSATKSADFYGWAKIMNKIVIPTLIKTNDYLYSVNSLWWNSMDS